MPRKQKTLPGAVIAEMKRCGRPSCKCAKGELHGPYYYRYFREGGRLRKVYVKATDVRVVKAMCKAERARRKRATLERRERARAEPKRIREANKRVRELIRLKFNTEAWLAAHLKSTEQSGLRRLKRRGWL